MKKLILFFLISFMCINSYSLTYKGCEYSEVARMQSIVSNINLSYDYKIIDNQAFFDITITNITDDIYIYDTFNDRYYYYKDTVEGELTVYNYKITSGSYKFFSNNQNCYGMSLGTKYYTLPLYNKYYGDPLCEEVPNHSLCQKWKDVNYSYEEFEKIISEYKNSKPIENEDKVEIVSQNSFIDSLINVYIKYYYFFLVLVIVVCSVIIAINNKKNKFKL